MKQIKKFKSMKELNAVIKVLEEKGITFEADGMTLFALAGDIIKVRDIILDTVKEVRAS